MARRPPLSKAEMEVVRVLWDLGSATVRQVHEVLSRDRKIDFGTVQTYLVRLQAKGYLRSRLRERTKIFTARVRPEKVIRETVDDFVGRLFGGEAVPLMRHLIQEHGISRDDISDLRKLLEQWEEEQDDSSK